MAFLYKYGHMPSVSPEDIANAGLLVAYRSDEALDKRYAMLLTIEGRVLIRGDGSITDSAAFDGFAEAVAQVIERTVKE
jgi:hypothetical protein